MGFIVHRAAGEHTLLRQLSGDSLRIGRDAGAELRLDDDAVALDHAVIRGAAGGWTIEDRGSVTGTYLGGRRVTSAKLAAGDVIEIGGFRIGVQITHPEDPLFVHVQAVGAGAAESPRPARGSATGSLRLDELVARARRSGQRQPAAAADTGPLRRLREIAAAAEAGVGAGREPARRRTAIPEDRTRREARPVVEREAETAAVAIGSAAGTGTPPEPAAMAGPTPPVEPVAGAGPETAGKPPQSPESVTPVEPPLPESPFDCAPAPGPASLRESAQWREPAPARVPVLPPAGCRTAMPVPPAAPVAAAPRARRIDYAGAYALRRPGLTKGTMTLLGILATSASVATLAAPAARVWLMPGISSAHAGIVGAPAAVSPAGAGGVRAGSPPEPGATGAGASSDPGAGSEPAAAGEAAAPAPARRPASTSLASRRAEVAERGCLACHSPWRGPAAVEGCAACHPSQAGPHAALLTGSASVPACAACHPEHRGKPLIAAGDERQCLDCHRDLSAVETASEPVVAPRVTSFGAEHPELVIEVPVASGGVRRLRLDDPAARTADPAILRFGHLFHQAHEEGEPMVGPPLRPTTGIGAAEIEERLRCDSCHRPDPASGRMRPVVFEQHCQACHGLTFDAERFPDCQVPHGSPAEVEGFLLLTFVQGECAGGTETAGTGSMVDRRAAERVRALSSIGSDDPRRRRFQVQVGRAMVKVFGSECAHCHAVDLGARPRPAVEPPAIPTVWMPGARFDHTDHVEMTCSECHPDAASSERTADVLLPGIATCRRCHGEERKAPGASRLLACGDCHAYHRQETAR